MNTDNEKTEKPFEFDYQEVTNVAIKQNKNHFVPLKVVSVFCSEYIYFTSHKIIMVKKNPFYLLLAQHISVHQFPTSHKKS